MTIGENIMKIREQFDLTQEELGEIAGVSGAAVSTWERGVGEPRMGAIQKISDALHIKKSDIVDDEPVDDTKYQLQRLYEQPGMRMLFDAASDLTPDELAKVTDMIKAFKGGYR